MADMIRVQKAVAEPEISQVFALRKAVFVEEQGVPAELEYSGDESAHHYLATLNDTPCGAARWRKTANGIKLERFAVLPQFRNKGVGAALLKTVLADLPAGSSPVYLNAQLTAVRFYERHGFQCEGDVFEEAGISHRKMQKNISG